MKKFTVFLIVSFLILLISVSSYSQISTQPYVGARPLGLGGAFSAVANDANTVYWNPAGLPYLQRQEVTSMYGKLFGLNLVNSYIGYVFPVNETQALGADWYHSGFGDSELDYRMERINLAYGHRVHSMVSVGLGVKYYNTDLSLDNNSMGKADGLGFDGGIIFSPISRLRFAFTVQDIGGSSIKYDNDRSEEIYKQKWRVGTAFSPMEGLLLALDVDDRYHIGAEYWPISMVAVRGGFQNDIKSVGGFSKSPIISVGSSIKYKFLQFDYAFEHDPDLPATHRFSVSFFFNPALVSIKDANIVHKPVFRSLYRNYENDRFAQVVLKNSSDNDLPVQVSIDIPTLTKTPHVENILLEPLSTKAYSLGISFPEDLLAQEKSNYDNLVQPTISVKYTQDKVEKQTDRKLEPIYLMSKNKITWSNPERVAAFITTEDNVVDRFARTVIQQFNDVLQEKFNNSNIGKAAILFDALGKYGIVYNPDRQTPWYKIQADSSIMDNIQYPVELLRSKIGDCDDCTVLFASLLENLNIETVLLDVFAPGKGHIYLMFDSEIDPSDVDRQFIDDSEYVIWEGKVWIPIETTMYGFPFFDAWRNGVSEYHKMKDAGYLNELSVREAKQQYTAGQLPGFDIKIPDKETINDLVAIDVTNFDRRLEEIATAAGVSMDNPDGIYDAAATYMNFNRLDKALELLQQALELRPDFGDALNAIGVIYTKKRQYEQALNYYNRALKQLPTDAGIRMNIALTYILMGRRGEAQEEFQKVLEMDDSYEYLQELVKPKQKEEK